MKKYNFGNKGNALIGIIIVLVSIGLMSGGLYYYLSKQTPEITQSIQKSNEKNVKSPEVNSSSDEEKQIIQKCSDGTIYNECSINKPNYCDNGDLIDKASLCGCPTNYEVSENRCLTKIACQNECSQAGLKRCSNNGYQICGNYNTDNCLEWSPITNCSLNTFCQNGNCIQQKCLDGTLHSQCSTNKPKYCDKGNLVNKCSLCGCSNGKRCQDEECIINPLILVVVNSSILSGIQSSLNQYKADLESEGYKVNIISTENGTPSDLKASLQKKLLDNLTGAFLIGDLPIAWFERQDKDEGYLKFPTDFFYMDLDGSWTDADGNGVFDKHENGSGNKQPEIWIGRLTPNGFGSQIDLINNYFRKDHAYRKNQLALSYRALVYEAGKEMEEVKEYQPERYGADKIYGDNITFVPYDKSSSNGYLQRLSEGYQWIYLSVHSGSKTHCFRPECSLFSSEDVYSADPKSFFYLLHACSANRYTENEYLGGAYVFAPSYGLTVIGTTDTGALLITNYLFSQISQNKSLGDAYKNWTFELVSSDHFCETSPICQYTFLGDPTLKNFP